MAAITGAIIRAGDSFQSVTAITTPSAFSATQMRAFASTVSGAVLMGYGTTHDVALKNRAGTTVIGITSNTTGVTMAGALAITGALSGITTLTASGNVKIGGGAASNTSVLMVNRASGTATGIQLFQDSQESWQMEIPASQTYLIWSASGVERMRLTNTGALSGITTLSTTTNVTTPYLELTKTTEQARIRYDGSNYLSITVGSTGGVTYDAVGAGSSHMFSDSVSAPYLELTQTTEQLRVRYDGSNYYTTTVSSAGAVTFNAVGASAGFTFSDAVNVNGNFTVATTGAVSGITTLAGTGAVSGFTTISCSSTITTGAPTGGAGAWLLGIANAVSPTSPNRTITVDIGGTLYYIHAKTTND